MAWKQLLAYITGSVDQGLLLRHEYLVTENLMLRQQIRGRLRLSDSDRKTLAAMGKKLGKQALEEEALSRLILCGERALWHTLNESVTRYHQERPHQSKGNVILMPCMPPIQRRNRSLQCRERFSGLLQY